MSRFSNWISNFSSGTNASDATVYLDIGSTSTQVLVDKKLLLSQPTCVALQTASSEVIVTGEKAQNLMGKTPQNVSVAFPIENGAIADRYLFAQYLGEITQKLPSSLVQNLTGRRGLIAMPNGLTPVAQATLKTMLQSGGFSTVQLIPQAEALAVALMQKQPLESVAVVIIGGQLAEVSVVSMGKTVSSHTAYWGGVQLTERIQQFVQEQHHCAISWHTAERIKKEVVSVDPDQKKENKISIRGKDVVSQSGMTVVVSSKELLVAMEPLLDELVYELKQFFTSLPVELGTAVLENGLFLAGGGSLLSGLEKVLIKELKTEVTLVNNAQEAIVRSLPIYEKNNHQN